MVEEVERYENEGIRIQRQNVKTQDKEESNNKTKEEQKWVYLLSKWGVPTHNKFPITFFLTHLLPLVKIYWKLQAHKWD